MVFSWRATIAILSVLAFTLTLSESSEIAALPDYKHEEWKVQAKVKLGDPGSIANANTSNHDFDTTTDERSLPTPTRPLRFLTSCRSCPPPPPAPTPPQNVNENLEETEALKKRVEAAENNHKDIQEAKDAAIEKAEQDSFERSREMSFEGSVGGGASPVAKGAKMEGGYYTEGGGSDEEPMIDFTVTFSFTAWWFPFLISSFYVVGAIEG